ncbi:MAG: BACON domain-containing protein [Vicinamibacterales bacterium]|nr:BACON domain-containing protein [Vicinamibacterales bacterium]
MMALAAAALLPRPSSAQVAVNPTQALFEPSPDHNVTDPTGAPVVQSYQLDLFLVGASAPFQTVSLGKPDPDGTGTIAVDLTSLFIGWPVQGTNYFASVAAVGPGGTASSAPSNIFTFAAPVVCSFTASPSSPTLAAASATEIVNVTTTSGCVWSAVSDVSWITVIGDSSGTGNGFITYEVAPNVTLAARTGTLTVAGQTVTVTQSGVPCTFVVSPTSLSLAETGGSQFVAVATLSGCTWTAVSDVGWMEVTGGSSSTGTGTSADTVVYTVAANTTVGSRVGTLTIAGQTITVTQSGAPCTFVVSPTSLSVAGAGGLATILVNAMTAGCEWNAVSDASWITVTGASSGTASGMVTYEVIVNTSTSSRAGTLTIAGQMVAVIQNGTSCVFSLSLTSHNIAAGGGSGATTVTTATGCTWGATSNASWITVNGSSGATGVGTLSYTVAANTTTTARTGTLTVAGQALTVVEAAGVVLLSAPANVRVQ